MAQVSTSTIEAITTPDEMIPIIMGKLRQLPPNHLNDVLDFVQFLEYKMLSQDDSTEDSSLWDAVQANQQYKIEHPNEPLERYQSGEEFLEALADL